MMKPEFGPSAKREHHTSASCYEEKSGQEERSGDMGGDCLRYTRLAHHAVTIRAQPHTQRLHCESDTPTKAVVAPKWVWSPCAPQKPES